MKTDNRIMKNDYRIQVLNHFYFIKQDADWDNYRDGLLMEIECWCESRELKTPKIDDLPFSLNNDIKELPYRFLEGIGEKTKDIWDESYGKFCMENCVVVNEFNTKWLFDFFIKDIDNALDEWFFAHPKLFLD